MAGTPSGDVPAPTEPGAAPAPNAPVPAPGQVPTPLVPEIRKRSGLLARFIPIVPHLPPDPRRDQWYDTRWADPPNLRPFSNWYTNGGLYGLPWKDDCTASFYPSFFGAPGQNTLRPDCKPCHNVFRILRSGPTFGFFRFKPVGMYYDQGSYVPVYDLDPAVPGPGAWPWPFFRRLTSAGG
jgi:hypothetical protein